MEVLKSGNPKKIEQAKSLALWWVDSEYTCKQCGCVLKLKAEDKNKIHFVVNDSHEYGNLDWSYYVDCPECELEIEIFSSGQGGNERASLYEIGRELEEERERERKDLEQKARNKKELGKSIILKSIKATSPPKTEEVYECAKCKNQCAEKPDHMFHKAGCPNNIT